MVSFGIDMLFMVKKVVDKWVLLDVWILRKFKGNREVIYGILFKYILKVIWLDIEGKRD